MTLLSIPLPLSCRTDRHMRTCPHMCSRTHAHTHAHTHGRTHIHTHTHTLSHSTLVHCMYIEMLSNVLSLSPTLSVHCTNVLVQVKKMCALVHQHCDSTARKQMTTSGQ